MDKALRLLKEIISLGYDTYIVGGAPRDIIMGSPISDIDIATNCPMNILQDKFITYNIGQSKDFGILVVLYEETPYEVAQFRTESDYNGYRPGKVTTVSNIKDDVKRRDFTINAMAIDIDGEIIDLVGGVKDIKRKLIRTVGMPEDRFNEDYVRMIRAARFASVEGFSVELLTRRAIRKMYKLINLVTPERIGLEIRKAAAKPGSQFANFILMLDDLKLLHQILPEVAAMKYFYHDMAFHPEGKTVFDHCIAGLRLLENHHYLSKIGYLLHDVGKCISFDDSKYGWKMSYYGHAHTGAILSRDILQRLRFDDNSISAVEFAVQNHMKFHDVMSMRASKIARMVNSPYYLTLEDVAWADEFSRGQTFDTLSNFDDKLIKIKEIKDKWEHRVINSSIKIVDGKLIMKLLNIKPGPLVGKIKKSVEEHIIDEGLDPTDEIITKLIIKYGDEYDVT